MSNYLNETPPDVPTRPADPEVIRRDIEATRADLSRDVSALTEKVSPGRVVGRRVDGLRSRLSSAKEKVMGARGGPPDHPALGSAGAQASSTAAALGGTASAAPTTARQATQGNPLAAGLVAFGVGWLAASLLPASDREQQAAAAVREKAGEHSDTLTRPLKEAATEAADNLAGPARQAVESVRGTASAAAGTVRDDAVAAAQEVAGSARHAKDGVPTSGR